MDQAPCSHQPLRRLVVWVMTAPCYRQEVTPSRPRAGSRLGLRGGFRMPAQSSPSVLNEFVLNIHRHGNLAVEGARGPSPSPPLSWGIAPRRPPRRIGNAPSAPRALTGHARVSHSGCLGAPPSRFRRPLSWDRPEPRGRGAIFARSVTPATAKGQAAPMRRLRGVGAGRPNSP